MNPVPLIVVGGPLGSGKTTLLQHVLENARGRRLGVIVNEFGDLSIDGALLKDSGADLVEVSNGCVCCAVGGDLSASVHRVIRGRELDAIVVELSGVADPHPVLREVSLMAQWVTVVNLVTVVDLESDPRSLASDAVLLRLLSEASTTLMNKSDRVDAERLNSWTALAGNANPNATILTAQYGQIPVESVIGPFDELSYDKRAAAPKPSPTSARGARHARHSTFTLQLPTAVPGDRITQFFASMGDDLDRAKGFVELAEGRFLLQTVRGRSSLTLVQGDTGARLVGRVVMISSRLDEKTMRIRAEEWFATWAGATRSLPDGMCAIR